MAASRVPPKLKVDSPAKYPERAIAEKYFEPVTVIVVLEIDETGAVR